MKKIILFLILFSGSLFLPTGQAGAQPQGGTPGANANKFPMWDNDSLKWDILSKSAFQDSIGIRNYQSPAMYGVIGDFEIADTADGGFSRDDAAAFDSCFANGNVVVLDGGDYYINTAISTNHFNIVPNGSTIYTRLNGNLFTVAGILADTVHIIEEAGMDSLGIKTNAEFIGNRVVVSNGNGSNFVIGDMVAIIMDSTRGSLKIGETNTVRYVDVDNDILYMDRGLYANFPLAQNPVIKKVTPGYFNVIGELKLKYIGDITENLGATNSSTALRLKYCLEPKGNLNIRDFHSSHVILFGCLRPNLYGDLKNGRKDGAGYGFNIAGGTCDGTFRGKLVGFRHAVTTGGDNLTGIPWNNKVTVDAWGGATPSGGTWILDTHADTGSMYWINCRVFGRGGADNDGDESVPQAFNIGAITEIIKDCYVNGVADVIGFRGSKASLIVDGLIVEDGEVGQQVITFDAGQTFGEITLNNINAPGYDLLGFGSGAEISNFFRIDNIVCQELGIINTAITVPKDLHWSNLKFYRTKDFSVFGNLDNHSTAYGRAIDFSTAESISGVETITLDNIDIQGFGVGIWISGANLKSLTLNNPYFNDNYIPIEILANSIDVLNINGGYFGTQANVNNTTSATIYHQTKGTAFDEINIRGTQFQEVEYIYTALEDTSTIDFRVFGISYDDSLVTILNSDDNVRSLVRDNVGGIGIFTIDNEALTVDTLKLASTKYDVIKIRNSVNASDSVHAITGMIRNKFYSLQAVHTDTTIVLIDGGNMKLSATRTLDSDTDLCYGFYDGTNFIEHYFNNND